MVDLANGKRQLVQTVEPLAILGSMYTQMVAKPHQSCPDLRYIQSRSNGERG